MSSELHLFLLTARVEPLRIFIIIIIIIILHTKFQGKVRGIETLICYARLVVFGVTSEPLAIFISVSHLKSESPRLNTRALENSRITLRLASPPTLSHLQTSSSPSSPPYIYKGS